MAKVEGFYKGLEVLSTPYVDKDHVYLMNPKAVVLISRLDGFKPYRWYHKVRWYFKNLWKALRGK